MKGLPSRATHRRRHTIATIVVLVGMTIGGPPIAVAGEPSEVARPVLTTAVDPGLSRTCRTRLRPGIVAATCEPGAGVRHATARRRLVARRPGTRTLMRGRGRLAGVRGLTVGTTVTVSRGRGTSRSQVVLLYRVGDNLAYVRFRGFSRASARISTHIDPTGRMVARMRVNGRQVSPTLQRLLSRTAAIVRPAPVTKPAVPAVSAPTPAAAATRRGQVVGNHVEVRDCPDRVPGAGESAGAFDALWTRGGDGWTGSDGTYSVPLGDGRVAWLFGDTFLGPTAGRTRSPGAPFLNNALVVQEAQCLVTLHGGTPEQPTALFTPPEPGTWYWPGDATIDGGALRVFLQRFRHTTEGSPGWNFAYDGAAIGTLSLPDLQLVSITPVPSSATIAWGSAILETPTRTYIYGVEDLQSVKHAHVARVARDNVLGPWEYRSASGWSTDPAASARILTGVSNAFSVVANDDGSVRLITQVPSFSRDVRSYPAPSPVGPFGTSQVVATVPDPGPGRFTYNALVHPELSSAGELLLSYNVNTTSPGELYSDVDAYRPRFSQVAR